MNVRQSNDIIKQIIAANDISEQSELLERLRQRGVSITQSSLSRRLKNLNITKSGGIYTISKQQSSVASIVSSPPNMIVIKTQPGHANFVAAQIDDSEQEFECILGTVAGDDTIFAVNNPKYEIESSIRIINNFFK